MVVTNKHYEISGNAALLPKRKTFNEDEEVKELNRLKKEHLKNKKQVQNKIKAKVMLGITCIFVVGFILLFRYSMMYDMQKQLINMQTDTSSLNKQNDALRFQLAKYNNINFVQQKSADLHMLQPTKGTAVYVNLNKKNIVSDSNVQNNSKSMSFLEFIKSKLF